MSDETNQPPQLPDTSTWVRRAPGDVIEAGTPYASFGEAGSEWRVREQSPGDRFVILTPPPVEPAPWERIPVGRENAVEAWLMFDYGNTGERVLGLWWLAEEDDMSVYRSRDEKPWPARTVRKVELLHTYSPETQVPVERALIDEAVQIADSFDVDPAWPFRFVEKIATLADGAES